MKDDNIFVTEKDFLRIKNVLAYYEGDDFENLELELDRASIISDNEVPNNLVTMNSKVRFLNISNQKEMVVTLVYPSDSNFKEGKISILASLGSALLGLRVDQEICWMFPDGNSRKLKILEVIYQPESNQHWHL